VDTSKRVNDTLREEKKMEQATRPKYTDEFKREAVDLILIHGYGIAEAARNPGINANMLSRWKRGQERHGEQAFPGKGNMTPEQADCTGCRKRASVCAWRKRPEAERKRENRALIPRVREIHVQMRESYGARRMADELCKRGVDCGRDRALMRLADVRVRQKKKFRVTTDSNYNLPVAPNLLDRQFDVSKPNRVWVSDITYIRIVTGWLYLATVMDLYSRRIVGWSMDTSMTRKLVMDALLMAIWRRKPGPGLIHRSDRGSQYCSDDFQTLLTQYGMLCSMSRKGNCWEYTACPRV